MAVCVALLGCGRIGVYPLSDIEPIDVSDAELPPDQEAPRPTVDAAAADTGSSDASTEAPDAATPTLPELDAASTQDSAAVLDAAPPVAQDASSATDSGSASDAQSDASLPACAGARVLALCWYLGAEGDSCRQTCTSHGGYDTRTAATVGTEAQGGSVASCRQVLGALGHTGQVGEGTRPDGLALGCHVWAPDGWWMHDGDDFSGNVGAAPARIACACLQ